MENAFRFVSSSFGTLNISQKPVCTAHDIKNVSNTLTNDHRGHSANSRRKPKGNPALVKEHIESFHKVESHYRRTKNK